MSTVVHVVGTGTIGEPLVGLLLAHRQELGIDEVTFYKHSPRIEDRPIVAGLVAKGAKLAVTKERRGEFEKIGLSPSLTFEEALARAKVVIDCTPGDQNYKALHYDALDDGSRTFVAQGGEESDFGTPYAIGVNDAAIGPEDRFLQVVSCNTHNISVLIRALAGAKGERLAEGRFVCIRRASDVAEPKIAPAPSVEKHNEALGTHHATDVARVFETLGAKLDIYSSALKIPTQYMHTVWFSLKLKNGTTREEALKRLQAEPYISVTNKTATNPVFQFGREHGPYGRILAQTVVSLPSVAVKGDNEVVGFSFTPQDGNVLLSNLAAVARATKPGEWEKVVRAIADRYLVKEI